MRMRKNLELTVLVNLILIVRAEDSNFDKIVGHWNVLGVVQNETVDAMSIEQCTTFDFEKLGNDIYKQTRNFWNYDQKHGTTTMILRSNESKLVEISTRPRRELATLSILDWCNDNEYVVYMHPSNKYIVVSRDVAISSELLTKLEHCNDFGWHTCLVPHKNCDELRKLECRPESLAY